MLFYFCTFRNYIATYQRQYRIMVSRCVLLVSLSLKECPWVLFNETYLFYWSCFKISNRDSVPLCSSCPLPPCLYHGRTPSSHERIQIFFLRGGGWWSEGYISLPGGGGIYLVIILCKLCKLKIFDFSRGQGSTNLNRKKLFEISFY